MAHEGKGMSGYTVSFDDGRTHDFWAEDDLAAMVEAISVAELNGARTFRLCRTGYGQTVLREVANITDRIS